VHEAGVSRPVAEGAIRTGGDMTEESTVYRIEASAEADRPVIKFDAPANRGIDWGWLDDILRGERPVTDTCTR
jgi:hypothetical protein